MREVKYTARFKRDYRREKSGPHNKKLDALLMEVVNLVAADTPPPRGISTTHFPANGPITHCHISRICFDYGIQMIIVEFCAVLFA